MSRILSVEPRPPHGLHLVFADGIEGDIDMTQVVPLRGVFAPLADWSEFARVHLDEETGAVSWPGGADLDPLVLYSRVSGRPIEEFLGERADHLAGGRSS